MPQQAIKTMVYQSLYTMIKTFSKLFCGIRRIVVIMRYSEDGAESSSPGSMTLDGVAFHHKLREMFSSTHILITLTNGCPSVHVCILKFSL